jgi:glycosyltransferase involved in cell wall biosynthesis
VGTRPLVKDLVTFSTYRTSPGQRFRIHAWAPYLREHGIRNTDSVFATETLEDLAKKSGHQAAKAAHMVHSLARRVVRRPRLRDFDAALMYREIVPVGPPLLEGLLARRGGLPTAFDIDDPIFLASMAYNDRSPLSRFVKDPSRVARIVEQVDLTLAINEMIADHLRPYARRVEVVPNGIPLHRYTPKVITDADQDRPLRLGYSGSPSTMVQLEAIRGALDAASRAVSSELWVMGGKAPYQLERGSTKELVWTAETEAGHLASFDVGLAPAPDEELYAYKSPVKVLLYMAAGLPVIASPFGMAGRIVRHGETGLLAKTPAEWTDAIVTLSRDADLRARMGAAGRAIVERDYALAALLPRVLGLFEDLMKLRTR